MKIQLINQPNPLFSPQKQILINRGFDEKEIEHYFNLTDIDINDPEIFGEELLAAAATALRNTIDADEDVCIVVDCDCDGYTSSAILINYLHDLAPAFTENHVHWFMHESKQHGLSDAMDWIDSINPSLVIIPDAGSNDVDQLYELEDTDINFNTVCVAIEVAYLTYDEYYSDLLDNNFDETKIDEMIKNDIMSGLSEREVLYDVTNAISDLKRDITNCVKDIEFDMKPIIEGYQFFDEIVNGYNEEV
jgi:hypothetical protein